MLQGFHKSVLADEVVELLKADSIGIAVDCTTGDGGHIEAMLQHMPKSGKIIGIDRDEQALQRAGKRLAAYNEQFVPVKGNFCDVDELLHRVGVDKVDAVLADLGVSMLQITDPTRGFMFSASGPLSMRMEGQDGLDAAMIINEYSETEIADIIYKYGEERASRRIARAIVKKRQEMEITTTEQLADCVRSVVGQKYIVKTLARVFQSLRIVVNDELSSLEKFLPAALAVLKSGGRLAVIEYHSLESRLIKDFINVNLNPCTCPKELPQCICGKEPTIKVIKKLVKPTDEEIKQNNSARSARLRVIEKL